MTFDEYQQFCKTTRVYQPEDRFTYPALGLAEEAGEVVGQVKRYLRDDQGVVTEARREKILKELGDALYYLSDIADAWGFTLEFVAETNRNKLQDRKNRGTLHGEGSQR